MYSILISGTYKIVGTNVLYDISIFATNNTPKIEFITSKNLELKNYGYLCDEIKTILKHNSMKNKPEPTAAAKLYHEKIQSVNTKIVLLRGKLLLHQDSF